MKLALPIHRAGSSTHGPVIIPLVDLDFTRLVPDILKPLTNLIVGTGSDLSRELSGASLVDTNSVDDRSAYWLAAELSRSPDVTSYLIVWIVLVEVVRSELCCSLVLEDEVPTGEDYHAVEDSSVF